MTSDRARRDPTPDTGKHSWRSREGQVLVMFAAGLMLFLGMVALSVDAGFLMSERRQVQSAADAGALAAAKAKLDHLYESNVESVQVETGKTYGADNAATSEDNVDVNTDPDMDGFDDVYVDGINRYVEVSVSKEVDTFFLRALYDGEWGTSATAIAGIEPVPRPYALMALGCGPSGNGGIHIGGSGEINVHEGSIMSNCSITTSGAAGSSIVAAEGAIDAHGSIEAGPNWTAGEGINENRPQISDPIIDAGIEPPSKADAQAVQSVTTQDELYEAVGGDRTKQGSRTVNCQGNDCTIGPGYYGGNLILNVHGTLTMEPGLYYFGETFRLEGQASTSRIEGSQIQIYVTDGARIDPKNSTMILSSPGAEAPECEANLDAILLWIANGTSFEMQSAQANIKFDGVIYAPDSHVRLYGGPYSSGMQVIVNSLQLSGGLNIDIPYLDCIPMDTQRIFLVQ